MTWTDGQRTYAVSDGLQWADSTPEQEPLVASWTDLSILYAESDDLQWVEAQDDGARLAVDPWMDHDIRYAESNLLQWVEPYIEAEDDSAWTLNADLWSPLNPWMLEASVQPSVLDAELPLHLSLTGGFTQLIAELPRFQTNTSTIFPDSYVGARADCELQGLTLWAGQFFWRLNKSFPAVKLSASVVQKFIADLEARLRPTVLAWTGLRLNEKQETRFAVTATCSTEYLHRLKKDLPLRLKVTASMSSEKLMSGTAKLSRMRASGKMLTGKTASLDASFLAIRVYGRLKKAADTRANADVQISGLRATARMVHDQTLSLSVVLSSLRLEGTLRQTRGEAIILTHKRYPEWQSWHSQ